MKKFYFYVILLILPILLAGCGADNNSNQNVSAEKNVSYDTKRISIQKPVEELLYSFSTPIQDKSEGRQNNIRLTCSSLNGTVVNSGSTFSFCDTVGKATTDRGYQEAKIFGADGEVTMGLGGGNCQVSSTLYNVVLQDANFEIVERHSHAQRVYYVDERKRCCSCMW